MLIVYFIKIFRKIVQRSGEPPQSKCSAKDAMFCSSGPMLLCVCLFVCLFLRYSMPAILPRPMLPALPLSLLLLNRSKHLEKRIPSEASGNRCHMSR